MSTRSERQAPSIFISYRIADTLPIADRLAAELQRMFGANAVYFDRRTVEPGEAWDSGIEAAVKGAEVVLVLIGRKWLTEQNQHGRQRLDDPDDWVRREVEAALVQAGSVIPVLVGGASPPSKEAFAHMPSLAELSSRQGARLRIEDWDTDFRALAERLAKSIPSLKLDSRPAAETPVDTEPQAPPRLEDNPYRSLAAFQEEDARWFFGREELTRDTLARFYSLLYGGQSQPRFLGILGPSGSGKSSFARAGLMAQLKLGGGEQQAMATLVPGEHPMAALSAAVASACGAAIEPVQGGENEESANFPSPLAALPPDCCTPLVLLVDQFEEVWSQCDDEAEREAFIGQLLDASITKGGPVAVIITLRSDFLAQTQRHPRLNALLSEQSLLVPALGAEGLRAAISEPASRAGHPLDNDTIGNLLEESLGRDAVLPLLQFALSRIWQGMAAGVDPDETQRKIGGVGGALASAAEAVYNQLSPGDQAIARRAFTGMVQLGEGAEDTRRRVHLERLVGAEGLERVHTVLQQFADPNRRLITFDRESATPDGGESAESAEGVVVEVTHEALFSHWNTLREWLDQGREDIRLQRRLETVVEAWLAAGKPAGSLWRPPDLSLLQQFHREHAADMTPDQLGFLQASEDALKQEAAQQRRIARLTRLFAGAMTLVAIASVSLAGFFGFATRYGLDVAQAVQAISIRYGPVSVPLPEMVTIEAGDFWMGSDDGGRDERPRHKVTFANAFKMSATEVTFEQYDAFAETLQLTPPSDEGWGRAKRPVINVSWWNAEEYARWVSAVTGEACGLPNEAEWEYAARAGTQTAYGLPAPGGSKDISGKGLANCDGCGSEWDNEETAPVRSFEPNAWGLHDMHGNVWEWVEDCWHENYESAPEDGRAWLEEDGGTCSVRVLRGGSWDLNPDDLRSSGRGGGYPDYRHDFIGFRLVCRPHSL